MQLQVNKTNFRNLRVVEPLETLKEGQARITIDRFALTANNVSYALSGDYIGYWGYYPTDDSDWGNLCVWGIGIVADAGDTALEQGERLYGFWPMAADVVITPGRVRDASFDDVSEHRASLPSLYNRYQRTRVEPDTLRALEDERSIYFPLFMTSYLLRDFLESEHWFNAQQIIIGSVSSKTGFGLAMFIKQSGYQGRVVGLTSPANVEFVEQLDCCDQVLAYGRETELTDLPSVYVDMSGDSKVRASLHEHLKANLVSDQMVGATHWNHTGRLQQLAGAEPEFFFAPAQITRRDGEWGKGKLAALAVENTLSLIQSTSNQLVIERVAGQEHVTEVWQSLLDNQISGGRGIICSLSREW